MSLRPLYDGAVDHLELTGFLQAEGFTLCQLSPGFSDAASGDLLQVDGLFVRRSVVAP